MSVSPISPESDTSPRISQIEPIRVWDDSQIRGTWILRSLSNKEAIPTLWEVLHLINADWQVAAADHSDPHEMDDLELPFRQMEAFKALKPRYIQCLFSYINFFFTLENGFQVLLSELGQLNKELALQLPIPKQPPRTSYIEKLRRVRNHTVVHWGGPSKKNDMDSRAGRLWGFSWPADGKDLTGLAFGNTSLVGASDRVLQPLPETHKLCIDYLKLYDDKCTDLFTHIVSHLPITIGTRKYGHTKRTNAV